jgi:hypothetical protein
VVSFTPRLLYPQGKSLWYPLDRRLGGPQSRSGCGGEEKNSQPPPGIARRQKSLFCISCQALNQIKGKQHVSVLPLKLHVKCLILNHVSSTSIKLRNVILEAPGVECAYTTENSKAMTILVVKEHQPVQDVFS